MEELWDNQVYDLIGMGGKLGNKGDRWFVLLCGGEILVSKDVAERCITKLHKLTLERDRDRLGVRDLGLDEDTNWYVHIQ